MNERTVLIAVLRGMMAGGVAVLLWVGLSMMRGPRTVPDVPSVRVAKLVPGSFVVVDAPRLPAGAREPLMLLVLRDQGNEIRAFYLPIDNGQPAVPVSGILVRGVPCEDFAPDFNAGDIGCRQARAGFEFALIPRWSLDGRTLVGAAPPLVTVPGREVNGDWLIDLP